MMYPREAGMWHALGEMRASFGVHLATLCTAYGVDIEADLATNLPIEDEESCT